MWSRLRSWLRAVARRSRMESEMDAELRFHIEAFAADPKNHPVYFGDVAHECRVCGWFHLSRPEWLFPGLAGHGF